MTQIENLLIKLYWYFSSNELAPLFVLFLLILLIVNKLNLKEGVVRNKQERFISNSDSDSKSIHRRR